MLSGIVLVLDAQVLFPTAFIRGTQIRRANAPRPRPAIDDQAGTAAPGPRGCDLDAQSGYLRLALRH